MVGVTNLTRKGKWNGIFPTCGKHRHPDLIMPFGNVRTPHGFHPIDIVDPNDACQRHPIYYVAI